MRGPPRPGMTTGAAEGEREGVEAGREVLSCTGSATWLAQWFRMPFAGGGSGIGMFREDSPDEAAFRAEVREWLEANLPAALRGRTDRPPPDEIMPWYRALSARGWVAPHWPREHGGMGASLAQQIVLTQELAISICRRRSFRFRGSTISGRS